jgi:DNA-binding beta-propeller fold protein YncE
VALGAGSTVVYVNASTNAVVGSVAMTGEPEALLFDPASGELVVAVSSPGSIVELAGTRIVETVGLGGAPSALASDPATGDLWVEDLSASAVDLVALD